jgi:preprotein translocase subunit Sec63
MRPMKNTASKPKWITPCTRKFIEDKEKEMTKSYENLAKGKILTNINFS